MKQWRNYGSLGQRLLLAFIGVVAISLTLVVGTLIWQIRATLIEQTGESFSLRAVSSSQRLGIELARELDVLKNLSQNEAFFERIAKTSETKLGHLSTSERVDLLLRYDQAWRSLGDTTLQNDIFINNASSKLNDFHHNFPHHEQLVLIDRYGGLVAATNIYSPSQYYYAQAGWWQEIWADGLFDTPYIGNPHFEAEPPRMTLDLILPVIVLHTDVARGVLSSRFVIGQLQLFAESLPLGETGELMLVDQSGLVLYSSQPDHVGQTLDDAAKWTGDASWQVGRDNSGRSLILSHAHLIAPAELPYLQTLGWTIIVQQQESEALAVVNWLTFWAILGGFLTLIFAVAVSLVITRQFTRPIQALTETATAMSQGCLDCEAQVSGPTELQTLAVAFNSMTKQLYELIQSLETRVAQRTEDLQQTLTKNMELFASEQHQRQISDSLREVATIINSSLDRDAVLDHIMEQLGLVIHCDGAAIFLQGDAQTLVIARAVGFAADYVGYQVKLASQDATSQVFETKQTISVADVRQDPRWQVWNDNSIRSWMGAPLLSGTEVIGVLTVDNFTVAAYHEADKQVLGAFAHQATTAIQNARLYTELTKLNADKDKFLSIMAHDLKGPFMPLLGNAELLAEFGDTLAPLVVKEMGASMHRSARNAFGLLESLLTWARLQMGRMEYNPQRLDIYKVAAKNVELLSGNAAVKQIELRNLVAAETWVYADENMLDTVIRNLTNNALKFTSPGGQVTIKSDELGVMSDELKNTQNSSLITPNYIEVSIADTGVGMPAEVQQKLFKIDEQVTTMGTGKETGTGLGLIICQEMVIKSGGHIWVESEVGQGTTVRFTVKLDSHRA